MNRDADFEGCDRNVPEDTTVPLDDGDGKDCGVFWVLQHVGLSICSAFQEELDRASQILNEAFIAVAPSTLRVSLEIFGGKPRRFRQWETELAQYPRAPTSTAK